jgi:transcriptional regulator with XRE-family HTH domain
LRNADFARKFGRVLQKHRLAKHISQESLAEKADLHQTHIGLIERGARNPSLNVAKSLADGLGLPLAKLIDETEKLAR